jgi:hypothetical protein
MLFRASAKAVSHKWNLAMTARQPAALRRSEAAEINHVRESLLPRLFTLFDRQNSQIA